MGRAPASWAAFQKCFSTSCWATSDWISRAYFCMRTGRGALPGRKPGMRTFGAILATTSLYAALTSAAGTVTSTALRVGELWWRVADMGAP